jgi:hypothetical protein
MKKLLLITLLTGYQAFAFGYPKDTTIIEFNDKGTNNKVKVITGNNKTIELPKSLNLDNVLKAVGVDSNERERALVLISKGGDKRDTLLVFSKEGQRIKIITKDIISKKDTTIKETEQQMERRIEKEVEDKMESFEDDHREHKEGGNNHDKKQKTPKEKKFFSKSDFGIYIGLNNFANANEPKSPNELNSLRTWQSRYVALSLRKNATLIKGKKMDVAFSYGPEIAWYNFMLQNSNVAREVDVVVNGRPINQVAFVENAKETEKSKLVMPYVNFPVLLNFGFKEDKFKIGLGGYAGYRVGGYSMEKFSRRSEDKIKGDFGLNDFVYGVTAEIGKKNGMTLFVRYDMNKLFKENQTKFNDIQAFSVGFRL